MSKKGGKSVKININLSNRWLYTLILIGILAAVGVGVYAASYNPSGAGHPYSEISTCGANQTLKMNSAGTAWMCSQVQGQGTAIFEDSNGQLTKSGGYNCNPTYRYYDCDGGCTRTSLLATCPVAVTGYQNYFGYCSGISGNPQQRLLHLMVGGIYVEACFTGTNPTSWPNIYNDGDLPQSYKGHGVHEIVGTVGGVCATDYATCPNTLLGYLVN